MTENLFHEITKHLIEDKIPSEYIEVLNHTIAFQRYPFNMLYKLKEVEQSPKYHPEGNVWNHTMLVVDEAARRRNRSKNQKVFMWAALLHDIGKSNTTKNKKGKITAYNHDKEGAALAKEFLETFPLEKEFINAVVSLVRWHMQILFVVNELPFANVNEMRKEVDLKEVALLGLCDRLGRLNVDRNKEENDIKLFLKNAQNQI